MKILNIAAGKFQPIPFSEDKLLLPRYVLNVDTSYFTNNEPSYIENDIGIWELNPDRITKQKNLNMDIFEFMERTSIMFDRVVIYRFLEHVSFTQVEYFIYLVSTVLKKGGDVDIIVPNYRILADMILNEDEYSKIQDFNFQAWNILLTTELLNEPACPHASIWTPERIVRFWQLEGRFKVKNEWPSFNFDGRDIYLRARVERI